MRTSPSPTSYTSKAGLIKTAERAKLTNGTAPVFDLLPESDRADLEFFIEQINMLGFDFTQAPSVVPTTTKLTGNGRPTHFEMAAVGVKVEAIEIDGEFVLLKGSMARQSGTASWTSYKGLRD
jgi:hypothetical protein